MVERWNRMAVQGMRIFFAFLMMTVAAYAGSAELAPGVVAKLVKIIASTEGGKVGCRDSAMKSSLEAAGVSVSGDAKIVWASNPMEVKMMRAQSKLVVTGNKNYLANGAGIAITDEDGKPKIFLHKDNIAASGVAVSDSIYKIGER